MSKKFLEEDLNPSTTSPSLNIISQHHYSTVPYPLNQTFSTLPASKIVDEPLVQNVTKDGLSQELNQSSKRLLNLMTSHLDLSLFYTNQKLRAKIKSNSLNLLKGKQCKFCFNLNFKTVLACGHPACLKCLKVRIVNYFNSPSVETFKELRCEYCCALPSRTEVYYVFGENPRKVDELFLINVRIKCRLCERTLVLMKDFYPELKCLHICRDCYIDQLFCKIKNCIVCRSEFKYREHTLNRIETCAVCFKSASVVDLAFKTYENGMICFNCQNESVKNIETIPILFEKMKLGNKEFRFYFNKRCPYCNTPKPLNEIQLCNVCGTLKCDDCSIRFSSECTFCNRVGS